MIARTDDAGPRWWRTDIHAGRRERLLLRNRITAGVRAAFADRDFVEVETAALQASPGNEAHLHAFSTDLIGPDGVQTTRHLRTSPEFACKKLLAAGEPRLFDLARVWRNRERSATHHPEFTMLEWYRAHAPYTVLMDDCAWLLRLAADIGGRDLWGFRGLEMDPRLEPERLTVAQAFQRFAGVDLLRSVGASGQVDRDALAREARGAGLRVPDDDSWADIFSRIIVAAVEPNLGRERAVILCEYPSAEAALSRPKPDDPRVCERFELYGCGVELANAFGELTDPAEQRRRFVAEMAEMQRVYGQSYPIDEDFLDALAFMPPASGSALGFDRLVMLAVGAERIDQVLWSPVE